VNTEILGFFIILFLNLCLMAVRSSISHARQLVLMNLHEEKPDAVDRALKLLNDHTLPVTLNIAGVILHFLLAATAWVILAPMGSLSENYGLALLLFLCLAIMVIFLEFGVDRLIYNTPESWLIRLTPAANLLMVIFKPFSWFMITVFHVSKTSARDIGAVTDDEIKTWVEGNQPEGGLEVEERQMIYSILQFGDTLCREIMVPRIDIIALEVNTSIPQTIDAMMQSGHSRVPVFEETIDNIVGILYAKDLLKIGLRGENSNLTIRELLRPAYFVPEAKKVDEMLREMQARGVHIAIVIDEYGGMAGLVTLEDIVEEIVGEIRDEYDQSEEMVYQQISPDEFLFHGRIDLDDFNDLVGTELPTDNADTLGGFIYGKVGRVPVGGEVVGVDGWILTVEQVSGRRIRLVRALRKPDVIEGEEQTNES
jgi:putative hemolysin